jgi:hypothetical protein
MIELVGMVLTVLVGLAVWIRLGPRAAAKNKKNSGVRVWKTAAIHGFHRLKPPAPKNKKNAAPDSVDDAGYPKPEGRSGRW